MPLHSILANDIAEQLVTLGGASLLISLVMAFVMGFSKGFRRVSWSGLVWLFASVLCIAVCKKTLTGEYGFKASLKAFAVAVACVLAVMAVFGFLASLIRPKVRWVKDNVNGDTSLAEFGLEFEPEYVVYDGEDDWKPYGKRLQKTGYAPPSFFGRFIGALTCMVNVGMILLSVIAVLYFSIQLSGIQNETINGLLTNETAAPIFSLISSYTFEVFAVGVIFLTAKKGIDKGFFESLCALIVSVGGIAAAIVCFWFPFSPQAAGGEGLLMYLADFVGRCKSVFVGFGRASELLGKLFAGAMLFGFTLILLVLFNLALKKCCSAIEKVSSMRIVDACLACFLYALIGAAICMGIWFIFAGLDYFAVFEISKILSEDAVISNTAFQTIFNKIHEIMAPHLG